MSGDLGTAEQAGDLNETDGELSDADWTLDEVTAAMQRDDVDGAVHLLRRRIAVAPYDCVAWLGLAEVLAASSDDAGAASAFEQAARFGANAADCHLKAARSHARAGDFQASARSFSKAGIVPGEPVWAEFDPPGAILQEQVWAGRRLFVRLTPDPRLPLNTDEYDEAYHLDTIIGHGRRFWAFGPLFSCSEQEGAIGFGYNADRRYLLKFGGPFVPGAQGFGYAYPGYFYKSLQFSLSSAAPPVWCSDGGGSLERIRRLVNDGRRFRVVASFQDGWWAAMRANLVFCYRHLDRFDVRTGPIAYPDLFEMPHEITAPYLLDFNDLALSLPGFNPITEMVRTTVRVVDLTIRSDLTLEERTPTPFWSTRRIARLALFAD